MNTNEKLELCNRKLSELWLNKPKNKIIEGKFTADEWCFIHAAVASFIGKEEKKEGV